MIRQSFEELKASSQFPSPPGVGMRILKLTQDDSYSAEDISRTIMADSALTGRLLKVANMANMGASEPVTTIAGATMRLGMRAVKNIALGLSLISAHRSGVCEGFDYDHYWSVSLARAVAAQSISRHLRVGIPAETYVLGLLSEIGQLALASVHPLEYTDLLKAANGQRGHALAQLEQKQFEITHGEVGAYMLEEWGLPVNFTQAIEIYESLDRIKACENREAAAVARVLNNSHMLAEICIAAGENPDAECGGLAADLEHVRESLGMEPAAFSEMCAAISKEWCEWGQLLHVPTKKMSSPDEIHARAAAKPPEATTTPATLAAVLGTTPAEGVKALRILAVDDDAMSLALLARTLRKNGHEVQTASNGNEALKIALETNPQVVIADWMMPEMDGLDLCKSLRRIESGRSMFFLLLTGQGEEDRIVEAFDAGVDDYVVKPFNSRVLLARIKGGQRLLELQAHVEDDRQIMMKQVSELGIMTRKLRNAALTDVLTELPNRRYAMKRLETDWESSGRTGKPFSIIMIDIDHFKKVNDTYGHDMGDVVLKGVADVLRTATRRGEEAARLGGEEFLVICPNTTEAQAATCAERLRAAVEANVVKAPGFTGNVTVSLGVAERSPSTPAFDALIKAADDAVYAAKSGGRNRYHVASSRWNKAQSA